MASAPAVVHAAAGDPGVDTDLDGVGDFSDAFPCDWRRSAVSFVPGELDYATLLFEDNWPARGDLDFNDSVLLHHVAVFWDGSGRATGLRLTLVPRAIGAQISSGVALRLPLPASTIASIERTVGSGSPAQLTVLANETDLVIPIVTSLRDLFNGAAGFYVNTDLSTPNVGDGNTVTLDLSFHTPVALPLAADPFDLYYFRTDDPRHQIHRPEFSGTGTMNDALFGTQDDGSNGQRYFVDGDGLPFVLSVPEPSMWALEQVRVERMWPGLVDFAASGGAEARDFYTSHVNRNAAYPAPTSVTPPPLDFGLCVAPSCTDGARNGLETDVDCGGGCGPCGLGAACRAHDDCAGGVCAASACVDANERGCTIEHGRGTQTRTAGGWGACVPTACDAGYRASGGACVLVTYAWTSGPWSACSGASAAPSYGSWGGCDGGVGAWSYGAWGTCSAAAACSGAGTQSRSATCEIAPSSGTQSRAATCVWNASTGTQTRTRGCANNFGETVADALCASAAPPVSQSCTPAGTPASCGAVVATQACTPTDVAVCGASTTAQACASPAGSQSCTVGSTVGTQTCAAGATTWSACVVPAWSTAAFVLDAAGFPGSTATWSDGSGNGNHATLVGAPGYSASAGGQLSFDGVSQYGTMAPGLDLGTRDFSLIAYVRTQTFNEDGGFFRRIFSLGSDGNRAGNFQLILDTASGAAYMWSNTGQLARIGNIPVSDNVWHQLVVTRAGNLFTLYVDGMPDVTTTFTGALTSNGTPPVIGRYTTGNQGRFQGAIGRLELVASALSANDVAADFATYRGRFGRGPAAACGLTQTVALDAASYSGAGAVWPDTSVNALNASLFGGPTRSSNFGGYLAFDGLTQYATLPASPAFDVGTGDFTLVTSVRTLTHGADSAFRRIFSLGSDGNRASNFQLILDNASGAAYLWSNSGALDRIGTVRVADGQWHQVVATRVGNVFTLYVDGVRDVAQIYTGVMTRNGTQPVIGRYTTGASGRFQGAIGRVSMLPCGMSASEVASDYQASRNRFGPVTAAWSSNAWGSCTGASSAPSYGSWGTCTGGSGSWSYSAWSACSASAVCSGSGTQSRTGTCNLTAASGSQSRTAACAWNAGTGTQTRTNSCVNGFGETVASAQCTGTAPLTSQSCTPGGTPSSCGTLQTSQACTPTDTALCGAATTSQSCASPSGSQSCTITNGAGSQTCAAGASTWGTCTVVSCNSGYNVSGNGCVAGSPAAGLALHLDAGNATSAPNGSSTWFDLSGNGRNATLSNGAVFNATNGGSVYFDGVNDEVVVPGGFTAILRNATAYTFSVWLSVRQFSPAYPVIFSIGRNPPSNYYEFFLETSASQTWMSNGGALNSLSFNTNANQVYNFVWVLSGSTGYIYRNGALMGSFGGMTASSNITGDILIGTFKNAGYELAGNVYQVQAYTRALNATEVSQVFNGLRGRFGL